MNADILDDGVRKYMGSIKAKQRAQNIECAQRIFSILKVGAGEQDILDAEVHQDFILMANAFAGACHTVQ